MDGMRPEEGRAIEIFPSRWGSDDEDVSRWSKDGPRFADTPARDVHSGAHRAVPAPGSEDEPEAEDDGHERKARATVRTVFRVTRASVMR